VRGSRGSPRISSTGFLGDSDSTEPVVPEGPFHRALEQPGAERAGLDHVVDVVLDTGDRDQSDDLNGVADLGHPRARRAARHGTARRVVNGDAATSVPPPSRPDVRAHPVGRLGVQRRGLAAVKGSDARTATVLVSHPAHALDTPVLVVGDLPPGQGLAERGDPIEPSMASRSRSA
jgi:hypothetical protein